jgi:hypothetical protein
VPCIIPHVLELNTEKDIFSNAFHVDYGEGEVVAGNGRVDAERREVYFWWKWRIRIVLPACIVAINEGTSWLGGTTNN